MGNNATKEIQKIMEQLASEFEEKHGRKATSNDMDSIIDNVSQQYNDKALPEFDGFSPNEMHDLCYGPLNSESTLKLCDIDDKTIDEIPIMRQAEYLLHELEKGEIKLTAIGNLPPRYVQAMYPLGAKIMEVEKGLTKVRIETDITTVFLTHDMLKHIGLIKERNKIMSLTKAGKTLMKERFQIWQKIADYMFFKYYTGCFDGYENQLAGIDNKPFSVALLIKYGDKERSSEFYADKYFTAFPMLRLNEDDNLCYETRAFTRFMHFMGIVEIKEHIILDPAIVKKTHLCDKLFEIKKK